MDLPTNHLHTLIEQIVQSPVLHAKWLNTLSYLENCGARAIAACEHPTLVKEEMLKHASEEFRHAYHLKKQIRKLGCTLDSYSLDQILGGIASLHYLKALNLQTSRYLKNRKILEETCYLFVSYVIELRAEQVYPIYHQILKQTGSKVSISSLILEEKEHLHEMKSRLLTIPEGLDHARKISILEGELCKKWLQSIQNSINEKNLAI